MNIKGLLLGSAAALAVVSGAQAADAVVAAEPEPMEYVKVCDAYGTGYFYIPGTETCLAIGGYVQTKFIWGKTTGAASTWDWQTKVLLTLNAKNDSEFGTVYSYVELKQAYTDASGPSATTTTTAGVTTTDLSGAMQMWGYAGIGGFELGNYESVLNRVTGYGLFTDAGGDNYGYHEGQYVAYTLSLDTITAFVTLENDYDAGSKYMPDVTGGVKASFGDWTASLAGYYDESDDSFAAQGKITGSLGMLSVGAMALYSNSANNELWGYDGFGAIVGASAAVTDTVSLAADVQWYDNNDFWVGGDVVWKVANGFQVLAEGTYSDKGNTKSKGFFLRVRRSF